MGNIIEKMRDHVPESFLGNCVFLATFVAITALDQGPAIEAIIFFSERSVRHL